MLIAGSTDAADAAFQVGYESPSQFSREYARMYGLPPKAISNVFVILFKWSINRNQKNPRLDDVGSRNECYWDGAHQENMFLFQKPTSDSLRL